MREVSRHEGWQEGDVLCDCGKTLHLYYNGGELDEKQCCGFIYRTEYVRIDLVVYRKDETP